MKYLNRISLLALGVASLFLANACGPKDTSVAVTGVSVQPTSLNLTVGQESALTAKVAPETATNKNISWTSSNTGVATVADGKVTAVAKGTSTVTVTTEDGSFTASCLVSVDNIHVSGVTISPEGQSMVKVGEQLQLSAAVSPADAFDQSVTWYSDNEAVATVSASGLVEGVSSGITSINATSVDGGIKASVSIVVPGLSLSQTEASVYAGYDVTLTATMVPDNASASTLSAASSAEEIATASVEEDGSITVTGLKEGTATITVTATETGLTATCTVTVMANNGGGKFDEDDYGQFN